LFNMCSMPWCEYSDSGNLVIRTKERLNRQDAKVARFCANRVAEKLRLTIRTKSEFPVQVLGASGSLISFRALGSLGSVGIKLKERLNREGAKNARVCLNRVSEKVLVQDILALILVYHFFGRPSWLRIRIQRVSFISWCLGIGALLPVLGFI